MLCAKRSLGAIIVLAAFAVANAEVSLPYKDDLLTIGKSTSISCTVTSENFDGWYKSNVKIPLDSSKRVRVTKVSETVHTLHVTNVAVSDGGDYTCRGGSGGRETFVLNVEYVTSHIALTQYLRIGTSDRISIDAYSYPKPTFKWTKDGQSWNPDTGRFDSIEGGSVKISIVEIADRGNYTCTITMPIKRQRIAYVKIEVIVFEPPRIIVHPVPPSRLLTVGFNTTFHCKAEGYPKPQYSWLNPIKQPIDVFNPRYTVEGEYFYISDVQESDVGNYTCVATNIKDYKDTTVAEISKVYVRPSIKEVYDVIVERGERAQLDCTGEGKPIPNVRWIRDGRYERRQTVYPARSVIRIPIVDMQDMGKYTCEVRNQARDQNGNPIVASETVGLYIRSQPTLNVKGTPLTVYSYLGNPHPVFIRCRFEGYPFPNVTIWFDNKQIANGTDFAMFDIITNEMEDFGDYLCWSFNLHGSRNVTVKLTHARHPSRPVNVKANVTCHGVTLSWDPPLDNGGMEIVHYVIEYGGQIWNTEDTYPKFYITNLKRDKMYDIKVWARNKMGKGKNSYETVSIITKKYCPPGRPIIWFPYEQTIDDTAFFLKWREPENNGGDPDVRYKVVVSEDLDTGPYVIKTERTALKEIYIDELKFGQRYQLEVFSYTKGGISEPATAFYDIPKEGVAKIGKGARGRGATNTASVVNLLFVLITCIVTMATLT